VHTMNPDIHLMCEEPVTVNVYRAECSLSDADSHFFPKTSPFILFKFCVTNQEQLPRKVRISNKDEAVDLGIIRVRTVGEARPVQCCAADQTSSHSNCLLNSDTSTYK